METASKIRGAEAEGIETVKAEEIEKAEVIEEDEAPFPEVRLCVTLSDGMTQEVAWGYLPGQDAPVLQQASRLLGVPNGISPILEMLRKMCPELDGVPGCEITHDGPADTATRGENETRGEDTDGNTRTMCLLADILAADLYRRTTGIRQEGAQSALADLAEKRAFDLLEACRISGYRMSLTPEETVPCEP